MLSYWKLPQSLFFRFLLRMRATKTLTPKILITKRRFFPFSGKKKAALRVILVKTARRKAYERGSMFRDYHFDVGFMGNFCFRLLNPKDGLSSSVVYLAEDNDFLCVAGTSEDIRLFYACDDNPGQIAVYV